MESEREEKEITNRTCPSNDAWSFASCMYTFFFPDKSASRPMPRSYPTLCLLGIQGTLIDDLNSYIASYARHEGTILFLISRDRASGQKIRI